MRLTRRQFLKASSASAAMAASTSVLGLAAQRAFAGTPGGRILVLVNLSGGNDPLNTLIPLNDVGAPQRTVYEQVRPDLALPISALGATEIDPDPVHGNAQALHSEMFGMKTLYDEGKLAVLNGLGYPNHSLSHFEAEQVWWSGDPQSSGTGWVGRHTDAAFGDGLTRALAFGYNPSLVGLVSDALGVGNITRFSLPDDGEAPDLSSRFPAWQQIYGDAHGAPGSMLEKVTRSATALIDKTTLFETIEVEGWGSNNENGESGIARDMMQIASILRHDQLNTGDPSSQSGLSFYHLDIGGFDTHSEQGNSDPDSRHASLLRRLSNAMLNFQRDLEGLGLQDRVATLTYSEFGRRIAQNDNGNTAGTDHGEATLMFAMGDPTLLNGGIYGHVPDLQSADGNGNLSSHTDFRSVYGAVIDQFLGGDHTAVLGADFSPPSLFV